MRLAHIPVYHFLSASKPLAAMVTTSISHSKNLSNLVKIYTNNGKYYSYNDSFTFKLAIFYDISSRADILSKAKMKAFLTIFKSLAIDYCYSNITISAIAINFD